MNTAQTRSDNVTKAIITRIQFKHYLVAAEVKYYGDLNEGYTLRFVRSYPRLFPFDNHHEPFFLL